MSAVSAKALFRATRHRSAPDARQEALLAGLPDQRAPEAPRRAEDFYPTGQPDAIRALLARDGAIIRGAGRVWEPAVGDGALAREILAAGIPCDGADLVDRGYPGTVVRSFYDWSDSPAPAIITNPPFSEITARDGHGRWLRHTLALPSWRYCALLLSWDWPAGRINGLGGLLDQHPFSWCYLLRWKLDFTGEGQAPQRNAWFVWSRDDVRGPGQDRSYPDFRWLDRVDAAQCHFLDWGQP